MATRFYLDGVADTVPISPTPDAAWENTSMLTRVLTTTTKSGETIATVSFADANATNQDILFRQYISSPLVAGQTITGGQALKAQCRVSEAGATAVNNLFFTVGMRVLAANGTTVQKTVLVVTRDGVEAEFASVLENRQFTATSVAGNYTTVAGDRLVIEIGMGGDPNAGSDHDSDMSLGSSSGADLAEDDTTTTANNPWFELTDTLTFTTAHTLAPSDTETLTDSATRTVGKLPTDTVTLSDTPTNVVTFVRSSADTASLVDSISQSVGTPRSDTVVLADVEIAAVVLAKTDSVTLTDSVIMTPGLGKSDTVALSDARVALVGLARSDTLPLSDALLKMVTKVLTDTVTLGDVATPVLTPAGGPGNQQKADSVSLSDSIAVRVGLAPADTLSVVDVLVRAEDPLTSLWFPNRKGGFWGN